MDMERLADISIRRFDKLFEAGMATICADDFKPRRKLTPRGHAALAAPRMTAKEYLCLRFYGGEPGLEDHGLKAFDSCVSKGWCTRGGKTMSDVLTPFGLKALNDVRAATGSAEYREDLK